MTPGSGTYESQHWRSVTSSNGANRYLQGAFHAPWDGVTAFCSSGRLRYGGISAVDHTHCKSNLQSYWVMAMFCCPGTFHTSDDQTQLFQLLSALCSSIDPSRASRQALLSTETGTYFTYSLTFPNFIFYYLTVVCSHLPQFLLSSYLLSALISPSPVFHSLRPHPL